jgi:signal recognition particle subunit SRP54
MFDQLTGRLSAAVAALRGRGRLTEQNIADTLREVRIALLEADVALPVVKRFIEAVKTRALGTEVSASLSPGQTLVGILHRELVTLLGGTGTGLALNVQPPVVLLLAGLQGAGKTTTAAKLARWLIESHKRRVLLVSTDVRRPAAILQLERLAAQVKAGFFAPPAGQMAPRQIALAALAQARSGVYDTLIVDTAGRLHIDAELMQELKDIDTSVGAHQRLFVVDAMAGQDALNAARAFTAILDLTGIILTKADGDARGGAALSVREVTGKPIVFLGVGEKSEALELFDPERMAQRILGMGDVVALVETVQRNIADEEAQRLARKVAKGQSFDLGDLRAQLDQVRRMGGLGALMDKLPTHMSRRGLPPEQADRQVRQQMAIIDSMTARERRTPGLIDGSRRRRIARGAGVQVQDVNRLMKQFLDMQRMMKQLKGSGLRRLMGTFRGGSPQEAYWDFKSGLPLRRIRALFWTPERRNPWSLFVSPGAAPRTSRSITWSSPTAASARGGPASSRSASSTPWRAAKSCGCALSSLGSTTGSGWARSCPIVCANWLRSTASKQRRRRPRG